MSNENLLKQYQEERMVKMRRYAYGAEEIEIIDVSLNQRRHQDDAYIRNKSLYWNMTQGLAILERVGQCETLRRGLRHCYSFKDCWLDQVWTGKVGERLKDIVSQAVESHYSLSLVSMQMTLGEECSVGYSSLYSAWTIGLGSRTIFLRGPQDLPLYQDNPKSDGLLAIFAHWHSHL